MRCPDLRLQIAYVGPEGAGKTSNLHVLQRRLGAERLAVVDRDRLGTLGYAFECLTAHLNHSAGLGLELFLYTVPAEGIDQALRRRMLASVDGVVFVADSAADALDSNRSALEAVQSTLESLGRPVPLVLQWNKRDLPGRTPRKALERMLNASGCPAVEAIAGGGRGVRRTLRTVVAATLGAHSSKPQDSFEVAAEELLPPLEFNPLPRLEDIPTEPDRPCRQEGFSIRGTRRYRRARRLPAVPLAACWAAVALGLGVVGNTLLTAFGLPGAETQSPATQVSSMHE